ncbi:hypothetical protein SAMN05443550_10181 [Pedobacter hartonius]|uniref:Uncharacterized protein n=1 Tax=Pedobacter hartonius TaxID=425514 RepID=A0A1H3W3E9_9SPHI|nr:hypothetical protein SAMN05443550_10181 [Pedobacter hartonius]
MLPFPLFNYLLLHLYYKIQITINCITYKLNSFMIYVNKNFTH